jgi:hypothetical protein
MACSISLIWDCVSGVMQVFYYSAALESRFEEHPRRFDAEESSDIAWLRER